MATTQYIGARYVPLFFTNPDDNSNNWKSGVAYDPLTIVTDLNQSYTSKIPVPASVGRPSENPTYWIMTGAYSAQVEQYRQEVSEYIGRTDDLETELDERTDAIEAKMIAQKNTIVIFGDSWVSNSPSQISNYVATHFGCTVKSYAVGGTGFNVPNGYKDQLNVMAADTSLNLDDVRFAIIVCGLNDHSINPSPRRSMTATEFATAFNEWKALYNEKFAGHAIPDVYWFHNYSLENLLSYNEEVVNPTDYWHQFAYYRTIRRSISDIKSCSCFGFLEGSSDCWQTANWRHPTEEGSIQYAENMCRIIDGAPPVIYRYQIIDGNLPSGFEFPSVTATFIINENDLDCEFSIPIKSYSQVTTSGALCTFDRPLPAAPRVNNYLGLGININQYNYANKTVGFVSYADSINTTFSHFNGRASRSVKTNSN